MKSWLTVKSIQIFSLFPLAVLRIMGGWLGNILWWGNGRSKTITESNIALCFPNKSAKEREQLAKESIRQLAIVLLETGPVWHWKKERLLKHTNVVGGLSYLESAQASGKGTILLVPHLGNWEVLGMFMGQRSKLTTLYQPQKDPRLDGVIYSARQRTGNTLAPTNIMGVKVLLKALKAGEMIVILPDQIPEKGSGEFAPFYGQDTYTMTLVYNLIKRTGASVVAATALRTGKSHYDIHFMDSPESIYSTDIKQSLAGLNECVQRCVELCPQQYQWEYNRFKYLPNGEKRTYS